MPRHFLDLFDINAAEAIMLLDRASALKTTPFESPGHAAGKILGLIFEKPSLRTRLSFEDAMAGLGGTSTFLRGKDVGLGVRESVHDFARVVSQYVAALAVRTFAHGKVEELARHAAIPIINALSDDAHPCQAMADMLTVREALGRLDSTVKLVFVGDGNNVARSLAVASSLFGVSFVLTAPGEYDFPAAFRTRFAEAFPNVPLVLETDPKRAVSGAHVVYTDVWASMGQEDEAALRGAIFAPYQVNAELMAAADPSAIFLHCLPAHRGEEVTDDVLDSDRSLVILQAANRLHFQRALLDWLLTDAR
ncbi:MAG TPA: ornithine carbamoyltransferase [Isosphaeraceae bacterium]